MESQIFLVNSGIEIFLISYTHITDKYNNKILGLIFYNMKYLDDIGLGCFRIFILNRINVMANFVKDYMQAISKCVIEGRDPITTCAKYYIYRLFKTLTRRLISPLR